MWCKYAYWYPITKPVSSHPESGERHLWLMVTVWVCSLVMTIFPLRKMPAPTSSASCLWKESSNEAPSVAQEWNCLAILDHSSMCHTNCYNWMLLPCIPFLSLGNLAALGSNTFRAAFIVATQEAVTNPDMVGLTEILLLACLQKGQRKRICKVLHDGDIPDSILAKQILMSCVTGWRSAHGCKCL